MRAAELAYLGSMLELEHEVRGSSCLRHFWSPEEAPPYWSPAEWALVAVPGRSTPRWSGLREPVESDAKRAGETWTGRRAKKRGTITLPEVRVLRAGQARHIVYRSSKWGPPTNYIHPFDPGTVVELGDGKPPAVLIVRGPPLRLTERGSEG